MRIERIIIPAYVLDKLHWKHHVSEEEVHQLLRGHPKVDFVEKGDVSGENVYLALGQTESGRYLSVFFIYKKNKDALVIWQKKRGNAMLKNKKIDDIPEHFASIEEASDFWDTHDAGDYEKYLCPVNEGLNVAKKLPQAVLLEYSLLEKLKKIARQRGTKMYYNNFDEVWRDLREVASQKKEIRTLTQQVPNRIVSVTDSSITVVSERGSGGKRELTRQRFKDFWSKLSEQKSLNFMEDIPKSLWRHVGAIIITFLAHSPCVEYTTKPRVLYLMENATHDLGTLKQRY